MSYFAQVINGIVEQVIVSEQDHINSLKDASNWIQTYPDANGNLLKGGNYASIGYKYDYQNKVFYGDSPYPSWILNNTNWQWTAPTPMPTDNKMYAWDEPTLSWKTVTMPL